MDLLWSAATLSAPSDAPQDSGIVADDLIAHLQFLQAAFKGAAWDGARAYLFELEDVADFLVSIEPAHSFVHVVPWADMPEDLRPPVACTVKCAPRELLTLLAGEPAELHASDMQAMQQFLGAFDFCGYAHFCEEKHLRPFVPQRQQQRSALQGLRQSGIDALSRVTAACAAGPSRAIPSADEEDAGAPQAPKSSSAGAHEGGADDSSTSSAEPDLAAARFALR